MSLPICKFFKSEQGCKFGGKCRYKHTNPSDSPPSSLTQQSDQNDASVRRSDRFESEALSFTRSLYPSENESPVRYQHFVGSDLTAPVGFYKATGHNEDSVTSSGAKDLEGLYRGLSVNGRHEGPQVASNLYPVSQQTPTRKPCHYFSRYGNCCFGSKCRFEHAYPNRAPRFQRNRDDPSSGRDVDSSQPSKLQDGQAEEEKGMRHPHSKSRQSYSYSAEHHARAGHASVTAVQKSAREDQPVPAKSAEGKPQQVRSDKICQFFLRGWCSRGKRCRFIHSKNRPSCALKAEEHKDQHENRKEDNLEESKEVGGAPATETESTLDAKENKEISSLPTPTKPTSTRSHRPPYIPQGVKKYRREEVDDVEGSRLRRSEIDVLMKRFPKSKLKVNRDCAEYFQCVINFNPTDPDWPYDVKEFQLQVDIPSDYPFEMLTISLPVEQGIPETVRRYVEVSIEEWLENKESELEEKGQLELVFRSFLRWLDRNIEDVVTEGLRQLKREMVAKSAGLEFISAKQLQKQYPSHTSNDSDSADNDDDDDDDDDETTSGSQDEYTSSNDEEDDSEEEESGEEEAENDQTERENRKSKNPQQDRVKAMLAEPERRGTEMSLKNGQLRESAATLYFEKICLSVQCERCKGTSEFMASSGRPNMVQCGQCSQTQMATFRPAMVHHFSSVIGYLDLDACLPRDVILQNCVAVVGCLHCAKDTKPGGVVPGSAQDHWCRVCHRKLRVATDGVRFTQLEPSRPVQSLKGSMKVVVPTRKRIPKDPAIQEGKPLPNFGTCKHYKKSYRWLRFPCCGKCYPCDVCHDSKEDHEMKFANRMICGFCCKEQVYAAEKPCKGCDMNLTKTHTKHWEGGQGCRDKITMSRNDKKKHSNMSKTVSKHSQKVKEMQSKKRTKLRHT